MVRFLFFLLLLITPAAGFAGEAPSLTPEEQRVLSEYRQRNLSASTRAEVEAWTQLGSNIGAALVGTAKQLGVATAEFAETPLGKIAVAIIVFKLLGKAVLGLLLAFSIGLLSWAVAQWILQSVRTTKYAEATHWFLPRKKVGYDWHVNSSDSGSVLALSWCVLIVGQLFAFLAVIITIVNAV